MKKIFAPLLIGGMVLFNSCNQIKLNRYNKENLQVYQDAAQFVRDNGEIKIYTDYITQTYNISDENSKSKLNLFDNKDLYLYKVRSSRDSTVNPNFINYSDRNANGLNSVKDVKIFIDDYYIFAIKNSAPRDAKFMLEDAKEYTDDLKKIMHDAGYKKY